MVATAASALYSRHGKSFRFLSDFQFEKVTALARWLVLTETACCYKNLAGAGFKAVRLSRHQRTSFLGNKKDDGLLEILLPLFALPS